MHPKDAEGIANSADPDQTAPLGAVLIRLQSDLGLHCSPRPDFRKLKIITASWFYQLCCGALNHRFLLTDDLQILQTLMK